MKFLLCTKGDEKNFTDSKTIFQSGVDHTYKVANHNIHTHNNTVVYRNGTIQNLSNKQMEKIVELMDGNLEKEPEDQDMLELLAKCKFNKKYLVQDKVLEFNSDNKTLSYDDIEINLSDDSIDKIIEINDKKIPDDQKVKELLKNFVCYSIGGSVKIDFDRKIALHNGNLKNITEVTDKLISFIYSDFDTQAKHKYIISEVSKLGNLQGEDFQERGDSITDVICNFAEFQ